MITEQDLQEAIAECKGQRNPNANTCIKLAAFLTIQRELYGTQEEIPVRAYSYADPEPNIYVSYNGDSDFAVLIDGKDTNKVLSVMDELMETLSVVYPRLYDSVIRQLKDIT